MGETSATALLYGVPDISCKDGYLSTTVFEQGKHREKIHLSTSGLTQNTM